MWGLFPNRQKKSAGERGKGRAEEIDSRPIENLQSFGAQGDGDFIRSITVADNIPPPLLASRLALLNDEELRPTRMWFDKERGRREAKRREEDWGVDGEERRENAVLVSELCPRRERRSGAVGARENSTGRGGHADMGLGVHERIEKGFALYHITAGAREKEVGEFANIGEEPRKGEGGHLPTTIRAFAILPTKED